MMRLATPVELRNRLTSKARLVDFTLGQREKALLGRRPFARLSIKQYGMEYATVQ
jgi:hypothetical protein